MRHAHLLKYYQKNRQKLIIPAKRLAEIENYYSKWIPWGWLPIFRHLICYSSMNSLKIAELLRKSPIFPQNRRFCKRKSHKIYIKRRLYARLGDFKWKTGGVPHFGKMTKKIAENRRFWQNSKPKLKTNTGNGFLGVDYISLDTSFVILPWIA